LTAQPVLLTITTATKLARVNHLQQLQLPSLYTASKIKMKDVTNTSSFSSRTMTPESSRQRATHRLTSLPTLPSTPSSSSQVSIRHPPSSLNQRDRVLFYLGEALRIAETVDDDDDDENQQDHLSTSDTARRPEGPRH
jgi:hypothetical protein